MLDEDRLASATSAGRVEQIRRAVEGPDGHQQLLRYIVPWHDEQVLAGPFTSRAIYRWLKPGGWASHSIDCRSHGWADGWSGHWSYSDFEWKLVRGARPWILNRYSCSQHVGAATDQGFEVASELAGLVPPEDAMPRHRITPRLRSSFTEQDLRCDVLFLQLRKPAPAQP